MKRLALAGIQISKPAAADRQFADGYASDDEKQPRPLPQGYGALEGDTGPMARPRRSRLSAEEQREYEIRQASAGPSGTKVRYLDSVLRRDGYGPKKQCLAWSQTHVPGAAFEKHRKLLALLPTGPAKTDVQHLREAHRFLRSDEDDDGSWESRLAMRYYNRLFKEYVICDLAGYKKGNIGFRWRTQDEVRQGRGQFQCAHKRCTSKNGLQSFEVDFKYKETGDTKRALVKVRLCEDCAYKLHYRRLKAERRRRRKGKIRSVPNPVEEDAVSVDSKSDKEDAPGEQTDARQEGKSPKVDETPTDADRRTLEALAWKGPDPDARTREDDFDDYFNDLLC